MAAALTSPTPSQMTSMQKEKIVSLTGEEYVALAQQQRELGHVQEALASFEEAWRHFGADCRSQDLWLRAVAGLGYADAALAEGKWFLLQGTPVDKVLDASLEAAHQASQQPNQARSRNLEGQLLFLKSKALFAKPSMTADDLDAATKARLAAVDLLQEAAVEALPWSRAQLQKALEKPRGDPKNLLTLEGLMLQLQELWPNSFTSCGLAAAIENIGLLFEAWASEQGLTGEKMISLKDFLTRFFEVEKRLDRKVEAEACSNHAPCTGNLPGDREYSEVERELVMLVSRDGTGNWSSKAAQMQKAGMKEVTADMLRMLWKELAPQLKKSISGDEKMACGHSCSTCPTRERCQIHDSVKDIEDL
mmetsp:Transcript_77430/g.140817  ORF Transcript_77430/g.140817 Transcript_77430/m.140817 type:complete len:363 (+) Transcript_77430:52-1140(+)